MAKRTRYTPEFKAEVVLEALRGDGSQAELCRRHNLSEQQVSKWKQQVNEKWWKQCTTLLHTRFGRFVKHSDSTGVFPIITRKATPLKTSCEPKYSG